MLDPDGRPEKPEHCAYAIGRFCRNCHGQLWPANVVLADGCQCNAPRGVNHGLVHPWCCTCVECDPAQTGSSRMRHEKHVSSTAAEQREAGRKESRDRVPDTSELSLQAFAVLGRLRDAGWVVAVHNDYRQGGTLHTFWLFTKGDRCAKGEGRSDAEALSAAAVAAKLVEQNPTRGDVMRAVTGSR
jgi:hypothetical protein